MDTVIDILNKWGGLALLTLFVLFVFFSFLYGVGRGLKRSWMRLATVVLFIGVIFLVTPAISRAVYNSSIVVYDGMTIQQLVDSKITEFAEDNAGLVERVRTIMPDFELFVLGLGFVVVNIVLFVVLYFFAKWVSWIVYAIFAKIFAKKYASKADKKAKIKTPQHRLWGGLVGIVQGLVLFFFLLIPINGLLGVVHKVADYDDRLVLGDETAATQSLEPEDNTSSGTEAADEVFETIGDIDGAFYGGGSTGGKIYSGVMTFTGIRFLSDAAFNYQTTVKLESKETVVLSKDLVLGAHLAEDAITFYNRIEDIRAKSDTDDYFDILERMNARDYAGARRIVNDVFKLSSFKIVNSAIAKTDELLASGDSSDNYLGIAGIKEDSFYADIAREYAEKGQEAGFITGLRAVVKDAGGRGLNILRDNVTNMIDIAEYIFTARVANDTATIADDKTIYRTFLDTDNDAMKIITTLNSKAKSTDAKNIFGTLMDKLHASPTFGILAAENADKIITNGNFVKDIELQDKTLISKSDIAKFLGATSNDKWDETFDTLNNIVGAVAAFADYDKYGTDTDAILKYLAEDVIDKNAVTDAAKYAKIDRVADALYGAVNLFPSVNQFAKDSLTDLDLTEYSVGEGDKGINIQQLKNDMVDKLFPTPPTTPAGKESLRAVWREQLRSVVEIAQAVIEIKDQLADMDLENLNLEELLGEDSALINLIKNNETVAEIVAELIEQQVNNINENIGIDFGDEPGKAIGAIADLVGDIMNAIQDGDPGNIADSLVGDPDDPDYTKLLEIADSGIHITLGEEIYDSVNDYLTPDKKPGDMTDAQWQKLKDMFAPK
jgi:hypothetical protein